MMVLSVDGEVITVPNVTGMPSWNLGTVTKTVFLPAIKNNKKLMGQSTRFFESIVCLFAIKTIRTPGTIR